MPEEDFFKPLVKREGSKGKGIGMSDLKSYMENYGGDAYLDEKCEERLGKKGFRLIMAIPCKLRPHFDLDNIYHKLLSSFEKGIDRKLDDIEESKDY